MEIQGHDTSIALLQAASSEATRTASNLNNTEIDEDQFEAAAKDFEAVYISAMLKPIFEQIEVDSVFGGGKGEEVFRGMMLQEYGKMISETGTLGIADKVKEELIRIQEEVNNA